MRRVSLALFATCLTMPGLVHAQPGGVKTAEFGPGITLAAAGAKELQHGRIVLVTMEGGSKVQGRLVRADANRLYVRESAGAVPTAVDRKKTQQIQVVKTVAEGAVSTTNEIQPIEIVNGNRRTVSYLAPTLSPGELSALSSLQSAENEVARLEHLASLDAQSLSNTIALQTAQAQIQELIRRQIARMPNHMPIDYDLGILALGYNRFGLPFGANTQLAIPAPVVPPQVITPTPVTLPTKTLVSLEALTKARQNLAVAQGRAVYDQGQLVAVMIADEK